MLAAQMESTSDGRISKAAEADRRFGAAAYAAGFRKILKSYGSLTGKPPGNLHPGTGSIEEQVQRAFLKIENLRLLCVKHNRYMAEQTYGKKQIEKYCQRRE